MSVSTNTGNAFLDSYARQINRLEKDPNATADYDAALEKQFAAVKAQVLGNGGAAHGSGDGGPAATHSGGTGGGGSAGGHVATVADSVAKIQAAAGPDAAADVKKIADGAAASIGGRPGVSVAETAAQAAADAAQQVIESGGTAEQAAAAARGAAQAVATAGEAGDPAAATKVANTVRIIDPAAITAAGQHASAIVGGGAAGAAVAAAILVAGYQSAALVIAGGGTVAEAAAAAIAAAGAAVGAVVDVMGAGAGGIAGAVATVNSIATATGIVGAAAADVVAGVVRIVTTMGGTAASAATAARSITDAYAVGGEELATELVPVINAVAYLRGNSADMTQVASAVTNAYRAGGIDGARVITRANHEIFGHLATNVLNGGGGVDQVRDVVLAVSNIVVRGGMPLANLAINLISKAGTPAQLVGIAQAINFAPHLVADAIASLLKSGGTAADVIRVFGRDPISAPLLVDITRVTQTVLSAHGDIDDVIEAADAVNTAFTAGGRDAALAVARAAQAVRNAGGSVREVGVSATFISQAAVLSTLKPNFGLTTAEDMAEAIVRVAASGGDSSAAVSAALEIFNPRAKASLVPPSSSPNFASRFGGLVDPRLVAERKDYDKLLYDVKNGRDQSTIQADAQQLAIVAAKRGDSFMLQLALMTGSGMFGASAADILKEADPRGGGVTLTVNNEFDRAYLSLEADIASGADLQKIKADADNVAQLATSSNDSGLASVASNISSSTTNGTFDQTKSLTDLMNNKPTSTSGPPITAGLYQKLFNDIQSHADHVTILADAAQLAIAAAGNGDARLEYVARNIGNSIGGGTYSADGSLAALQDAAPGTPGAQSLQGPTGPVTQPNDAGSAYLKLENDVEHGADPQTLKADAAQVKSLAQKDGNTNLVAAADAIINGIDNNTYSQLGAEDALMNNGATNVELGFAPTDGSSPSPDETTAYERLKADIGSHADSTTIINDVVSLTVASIRNRDFGLSQVALDIGTSVKGGTFDPNAALQALAGAAPGTPAAHFP
jgi:hypothetical protein